MRAAVLAVAALIAHAPPVARPDEALPSISPAPYASPSPPEPFARVRDSGLFGLALGAGFPDFATASLMYRPVAHLHVFAGPAWDYAGWGVQGGAAVVPWESWIAPVASISAGRYFRSDLSFLARSSTVVPDGMKPLLRRADYSYASVDVGLDLGSQRGLCVTLRAGLSYVSLRANGSASYTSGGGSGAQVKLSDPAFHGTLPSAKVGVQYWF